MTKKALEKLNEKQKRHLKLLSEDYSIGFKGSKREEEAGIRIQEYLHALADADVITETDRKCLFCYYTL